MDYRRSRVGECWEVLVWDGSRWFRAQPPITFDSENDALAAIRGLRGLAPAFPIRSRELAENGFPTEPPERLQKRLG